VSLALSLVLGYLIGGFPTGIVICKVIKGVDPRSAGSGSSGATNVSRVMGRKWAVVVLLVDALKGYLPIAFLAPLLNRADEVALGSVLMLAGLVAGHVWTPYAGFRGGKGVATAAGAMLALDWMSLLIALAVWIVFFAVWRTVSISSIAAALSLPIIVAVIGGRPEVYLLTAIGLVLFLVFTHRENIRRLIRKEERRLV
jgi:acyl phosphate:glycerol-3-phosphate acyltransferase